jgi:hypothetical protein
LWGLDRLYYGRVSVVSGDIWSSLMTVGVITQSAVKSALCLSDQDVDSGWLYRSKRTVILVWMLTEMIVGPRFYLPLVN